MTGYRRLIAVATVLTAVMVMLGAYVRLTDAGLGCPDWPGCYGHPTPAHASEPIASAVASQGGEHGPVSMGKAWREMIHRYLGAVLGMLAIAIAVMAVRRRDELRQSPLLGVSLLAVVILQGLFGMWTVTLKLQPIVVTGHLIGGLLTLSMLVWLLQGQYRSARYIDAEEIAALAAPVRVGLALVVAQIILGGWTSTNYAALICPDFPTCQGSWWPEMAFGLGFEPLRELGRSGSGEMLPAAALTAIHLSHRLGALIVFGYLCWLGLRLLRLPEVARLGGLLLAALVLQVSLGIGNVLLGLPLPVAVAHTGGAALLLTLLLVLNFRAARASLQI